MTIAGRLDQQGVMARHEHCIMAGKNMGRGYDVSDDSKKDSFQGI